MDDAEFQVLKERAHYGDAKSQYELGQMYLRGSDNIACSPKTAETWFNRAALQGYPDAQYAMGEIARKDSKFKTAAAWYEKAAENGHANAQYKLGRMYRDGKGVEKSPELSAHWFLLAAEQGDARAQFEVGLQCMKGMSVPQSYELAAEWFASAADSVPAASYFLGCLYRDGKGVKQSYPEAVRLFRAAADGGNKFAMHELGRMYKAGVGVNRSYPDAARLFSVAADKGSAKSKYELARLLLEPGWDATEWAGEADPTNRAASLLLQAAESGHEKAIDDLSALANEGNGQAMYGVARLCVDGKIQGRSDQEIADLLLSAHSNGCPDALETLLELAERTDAETRYAIGRTLQESFPSDGRKRTGAARVLGLSAAESQAGARYMLEAMARGGDPEALYELGCLYRNGTGVSKSEQRATVYFSESLALGYAESKNALASMATKGNADAQYALCKAYATGSGVVKSAATAEEYCRKAAERGHVLAMHRLGGMYENGEGVRKSADQAAEWYGRFIKKIIHAPEVAYWTPAEVPTAYHEHLDAARQGDPQALRALGDSHRTGEGAEKSDILAALWYAEAARRGDAGAMEQLAYLATKRGQEIAIKQLLNVAEQVNSSVLSPSALYALGIIWRKGVYTKPSASIAAELFERAAEDGHPDAQLQMGLLYLHGTGVTQSNEKAAEWLIKAADQGNRDAISCLLMIPEAVDSDDMYKLGMLCFECPNMDQPRKTASKWLILAAEQGHEKSIEQLRRMPDVTSAKTEYQMGMMYLDGTNVEQSDEIAAEWFAKAAGKGYADAQYELGRMHLSGRGVSDSLSKAIELFTEAAKQGHASAIERISWMSEDVSPDTLFLLGTMYLQGEMVQQSDEIAAKWLSKAAEQGSAEAKLKLKEIAQRHDGKNAPSETVAGMRPYALEKKSETMPKEVPRKPLESTRGLQTRLTSKDPDANIVNKSTPKTVVQIMKLAEQNDAEAQYELGMMYLNGENVPQSDEMAAKWLKEAAMRKNPEAQCELGTLSLQGKGVRKSASMAAIWFENAAKNGSRGAIEHLTIMAANGDANAQYKLGMLYLKEKNNDQSQKRAIMWLKRAAANKNGNAIKALDSLELDTRI